ncbi:unnamed protein product [Medioppia subpectinata]|uniref:Uncharacterized protein n=1 Tax=Medioppia subpectinata TaxID=1979941 RepID=A0A7R9KMI5_9ACAR|nr:unnamed protein product [Medioppia subpectinata]CAG2106310.1 unnamed protein product [Medioppia subpectinata]
MSEPMSESMPSPSSEWSDESVEKQFSTVFETHIFALDESISSHSRRESSDRRKDTKSANIETKTDFNSKYCSKREPKEQKTTQRFQSESRMTHDLTFGSVLGDYCLALSPMEASVESSVVLKRKLDSQLSSREDRSHETIDESIKECVEDMMSAIVGTKLGDNSLMDDMSDEFWDDLDITSGDTDVKSASVEELTTTSAESELSFKQRFELLLTQMSAKREEQTIDVSDMAAKLMSHLDSINDAIIGLNERFTQSFDPKI